MADTQPWEAVSDPGRGAGPGTRIGIREILGDRAVRVAILIVFVIMLGFGIIAPILPLYARSFGVGYDAAGLLISAFAFMRLVFDLFAGPIVDRYGERLAAAGGVAIVGVSSLLLGIAPNFTLAVIFRGAGGAGSSIFFAAVFSYLLRVVPKDRTARTLSVFFGSFNIGIIAGGPIGGAIARLWGLNSPILVYAGMCFVAGALYLRFLRDPERRESSAPAADGGDGQVDVSLVRATRSAIMALFRRRTFVTVIVLNFAYMWVVAGIIDTLVPLFGGEGLGMSTVGIGAAFAVLVATELLVLYPAGSLADRVGRRPLLLPSFAAMAVMIPLLGLAETPLVLFALLGLLGIASGTGGVLPAAMLSDVTPERHGTAVGVYRFFGDLGFVFGPLTAGVTADVLGFRWAFLLGAAPVVLGLVLAVRTPETLRPTVPS